MDQHVVRSIQGQPYQEEAPLLRQGARLPNERERRRDQLLCQTSLRCKTRKC